MIKKLILLISFITLTACSSSDSDDNQTPDDTPTFTVSQTFQIDLSGKQEVPMSGSSESASATIELDETLMQMRATLDASGVSGVSAAHIHAGSIGLNGDAAFTFTDSGSGTWTIAETDLSSELVADLQAGEWYVNVHTSEYPDGAVRGQIVNSTTAVVTFKLNGEQQVPRIESSAMGYGYATYDTATTNLELRAVTMDVEGATGAHIHTGRIGMNGDVLVGLEQDSTNANVWATPDGAQIDAATFDVLASGGHYVNVHTEANASGEIRGQILTDNYALVTFELEGEQEVPAVKSSAKGSGYALVNTTDYSVEMAVVTEGVVDATGAHIHTGRIGSNGDVLAALSQHSEDDNVWVSDASLAIDAATFDTLVSGGHYVNVHTEANASGELRGQILTDNFALVTFKLDGEQQVPAVNTMASGSGYALVDMNDYSLELKVVTSGIDDAASAHVHTGRVGTNGDILVTLEQDTVDMNAWVAPESTQIDAATFATLASGGHYVNVHSQSNASGELRGQILTDNFVLATFKLQGDQEVPAIATEAMGSGYALVNTDNFETEVKVVTSGVEGANAAHIHAGRIGMNGDPIATLSQSMDDDNVWMTDANFAIDADTFATLASGGHYINIHTEANASGELRGQILTDNFALATFQLTGEQEVPSVTTNTYADGYALVNTDTFATEVAIKTNGIDNASAVHVHEGRIGTNGDPIATLVQSETDSSMWMTEAGFMLDADIFADLASGGHYVNVHTDTHASGQVRGQILTDNFALITFSLNGEQEAPAVASLATGDGYAVVNMNDYALEMKIVTAGVADATAAHIHTGRPGETGPALAGLVQSETDANIWMSAPDLQIDADIFATMLDGGHYVNVHTPLFPNGEIRGQILTDDYMLFTFELTGDQQVPAVTTSASGDGYALVNKTDYAFEVRVITDGIVGANAAHVHSGPRGETGPIIATLVKDLVDETKWATAIDLTIAAEVFAELSAGGHYVNVHTAANASGEIRGQIE